MFALVSGISADLVQTRNRHVHFLYGLTYMRFGPKHCVSRATKAWQNCRETIEKLAGTAYAKVSWMNHSISPMTQDTSQRSPCRLLVQQSQGKPSP